MGNQGPGGGAGPAARIEAASAASPFFPSGHTTASKNLPCEAEPGFAYANF